MGVKVFRGKEGVGGPFRGVPVKKKGKREVVGRGIRKWGRGKKGSPGEREGIGNFVKETRGDPTPLRWSFREARRSSRFRKLYGGGRNRPEGWAKTLYQKGEEKF